MPYEILNIQKPSLITIALLFLLSSVSIYFLMCQFSFYTLLLFSLLLFMALIIDLKKMWIQKSLSNLILLLILSTGIIIIWTYTLNSQNIIYTYLYLVVYFISSLLLARKSHLYFQRDNPSNEDNQERDGRVKNDENSEPLNKKYKQQ